MISRCQWQHFEEKWFFQIKHKQTLPSSYDVELKLIEFFRKKVASFSKQESACPDQRFQGKQIKMIFIFGSGFLDFERKLNWLWRKLFSIVVKPACYVSRSTILGIVLGQIRQVFDLLYFFERKLSRKGCQNCFSWLHRNILGRKFFFINKKNFCHLQTSSQKFMDCFQKKFLPVLLKQHSSFREHHFQAKWCFWREYVVMLCFSCFPDVKKKLWVFGETIWACTSNHNSSSPKQRFYRTQIFRKN